MSHEYPNLSEAKEESQKSPERFVEVTRISTIFKDPATLESIADTLMKEGVISGFSIEPVKGGYLYEGKQIVDDQFQLNILVELNTSEETVSAKIQESITKHWDYPAIRKERVHVNEGLLRFVQRTKIEHERYRHERQKSLALALTVALGFLGMIGTAARNYSDRKTAQAVQSERVNSLERLRVIEKKLQAQTLDIQTKIATDRPLTETETDMGAGGRYEEFSELIETLRDAEREMSEVIKKGG